MLPVGGVFAGRFEIDRLAGKGGMGYVYRAFDRQRTDWVALKILHVTSLRDRDRFDREARVLAELSHPNIVAYVAHGVAEDGQHYLAMEWLVGDDLGERMKRGKLPIDDAIQLIGRLSTGLAAAHARGVIHRDLKPTNLFLVGGELGTPKLIDFGVARHLLENSGDTKTGAMIGTPGYMAPEQTRGERVITPAADVFSLGCVLYQCLTGEAPFVADHVMAVLVRILFEDPTPIEELRPDCPANLAELTRAMLNKEAAERPRDAAAVRDALLAIGRGPPAAMQGSRIALRFPEVGQSLLSVVLATPIADTTENKTAFVTRLRGLGVSAQLLAQDALVISVLSGGSAIDQAVVAARCALEVKQRWPEAVVSLATGRGTMQGRTAVGDVADEAARGLAKAAAGETGTSGSWSGGVLLDGLSSQLLEGRFSQGSMSGVSLLTGMQRTPDATRPLLGKATPCVGRDAELLTLQAQLVGCIDNSEARAMLITGAPGIGKSRLRYELARRVSRDPRVTILLGLGDPILGREPYGILGAAIRGLAEVTRDLELAEQRMRLVARVTRFVATRDRPRIAAFLCELCRVPFAAGANGMLDAARREPKIMGDRMLRAVLDWFAAEAAANPLLLVLDDLHWADHATVTALDALLRELAQRPVLVLGLARPEIQQTFPALLAGHELQEMPLKGLSPKACERLIRQLLPELAPDVVAHAVAQSTGNALFLEEIIRALAAGNAGTLPETVAAMLQARVQQLSPEVSRAVRAAALFGHTLWRGGVARVLDVPSHAPQLDHWLDALIAAELIERSPKSRLAGEIEYEFCHALIYDSTYALLGKDELENGHRMAAVFLEQAGELDAAVIADHLQRAGASKRAAAAYLRAAEAALETGDLALTMALYRKGLANEPDGETLGELHGVAAYAQFWQGIESDVGEAALAHVRPGGKGHVRALHGALTHALFTGKAARSLELVSELLAVEPDHESRIACIEALYGAAMPLAFTPAPLLDTVLAKMSRLVELEPDNPALCRYLLATRSLAASYRSQTPWTAIEDGAVALAHAREAGDTRHELMIPVAHHEWTWIELGDYAGVDARLTALAARSELSQQLAAGSVLVILRAYLSTFFRDEARQLAAEASLAPVIASGDALFPSMARGALSRIALMRRQYARAVEVAGEALQMFPMTPLLLMHVAAIKMRALCALGRAADAVQVAEMVRAVAQVAPVLGVWDTEVRVTLADTFLAAGDRTTAATALADALHHIALRRTNIADDQVRFCYLTQNPFCVRANELAASFNFAPVE